MAGVEQEFRSIETDALSAGVDDAGNLVGNLEIRLEDDAFAVGGDGGLPSQIVKRGQCDAREFAPLTPPLLRIFSGFDQHFAGKLATARAAKIPVIAVDFGYTDTPVIELAPEARIWLAEKGFDRAFGARPMARLIERTIKKPLSEMLLFGNVEAGSTVYVTLKDDTVVLERR